MTGLTSPLIAPDATFPDCSLTSSPTSTVSSDAETAFPAFTKRHVSLCNNHWFAFFLLGTTHLFFWNAFLNALNDISLDLYPDSNVNTTVALYMTFNLAALFVTMHFHWQLNAAAFLVSNALVGLMHLCLPAAAQWLPNRTWVLLVVVSLAGVGCSVSQACAYGLAASTPEIHSGWVSVGNGFAGLLSFPVWLCLALVLFPAQTLRSLWVISLIGVCFCAGSCVAYIGLRRDKRLSRRVGERIILARELNRSPDHPTSCQLVRKNWQSCAAIFLVVYVSLLVYPNTAPLSWLSEGRRNIALLLGEFQVGDFVGRYIPLMKTRYTLPQSRQLFKACLIRCLIFALFWREGRYSIDLPFLVHSLIILTLAVTNGWLITATLIRGVQKFRSFRFQPYRDRFSSLLVLFLTMGVCGGLWTADLAPQSIKA
eukprot:Gregarina_sp_Pseudo_9__5557@NODE_740_length_2288_cov_27_448199_g696_i0_p1_GENE_NODE_740_length_2288_cov_27_448199_g696_i0NODE_740_length_2288_cov_27_448199_g696_i0_p1_ORF_typecomplete_len426_score78_83Nucleoside_tran/PF01733_18/5_8e02Nucleoside_tran/PF01733_18/2_3e29CLN3/PF02487_17/0_00047HemY_N/PF07219_13/1e03HemY_N/PF07219_13/1_9_NODE_740_length_2288_cov_27_448199_g696_i01121389